MLFRSVGAECEKLGGKAEIVAKRPSSEANCDAIVEAAVKKFGGVDILVVASGQNKVSKIVDQKPEDFLDVMDANVTQSWLMSRAMMSVDPPAANPTNIFTGPLGHAGVGDCAGAGVAARLAISAAATRSRVRRAIFFSLSVFCIEALHAG